MFGMTQITVETINVLKRAQRVFHLTDLQLDLEAINPQTEDLDRLYSRAGNNIHIYDEIAQHVVRAAHQFPPVALVLDGNPMFFSDISWKTIALAHADGLRVEALGAVSCIDILPTQLGFEPGNLGMQIFEATQLVLYNLRINPYLSTLVMQAGEFGQRTIIRNVTQKPERYALLAQHLGKFFPQDHPAIFIRSAFKEKTPHIVFTTDISRIESHCGRIEPGMTLYIPRLCIPPIDIQACERLGFADLIKEFQ